MVKVYEAVAQLEKGRHPHSFSALRLFRIFKNQGP